MPYHVERACDQHTSSHQKLQESAANVRQTRTAAPGIHETRRNAAGGTHHCGPGFREVCVRSPEGVGNHLQTVPPTARRPLNASARLGKRVRLLGRPPPPETWAGNLREVLKSRDRYGAEARLPWSLYDPVRVFCSSPYRQPGRGKFCRRGSEAGHASHSDDCLSRDPVEGIQPCLGPCDREQLLEVVRLFRGGGLKLSYPSASGPYFVAA